MKQPTLAPRLPLLAALAVATALTACGRQHDDELTAGQKLDNAVADAKQAARDTKKDAQQAMNDAEMSASRAADTTARVSTDMAITAKVNAALVADDKLKATQINVDTREGQVTLTGKAPDSQSRERASTLASAVDGVKQVNNQLIVDNKNS
ncbi:MULTISPECIES: BON domain-containing protein [Roseateles]|uniref:BON domain-containing protein n=1 Tax=Pelomonas caseinilytica TaxID=2906763 RepID=A0ABS8X935_9BURK|nr:MULTISPECIES: BON domain-containing protein [unclassified Roseateles]MCE4537302.1 BON domain-containing protein [Pelomonas sp. P7]HEV6965600.1 BON domain-containing protein [Roseateles sp.]